MRGTSDLSIISPPLPPAHHPLWAMKAGRRVGRISGHARDLEAPMTERPQLRRDVLPIPDRTPVGLTTYDAKDPATSFPPIEPLRPPESAPNVLIVLLDDVGFAASSAFGGPIDTPTAERLAADGLKYNRFHTTALCSPTRQALLTGTKPPRSRHGRDHRDRDLGARLQLDPPEHVRAARRDAEAERLLDRAVRQVPRGARLGDEPDGPVQRVADRLGLRALLRLHRRARRTSTRRRSTATPSRSSSPRRRRRATTSPRT